MSNNVTMEQTNKLIPELRFPEFAKDEGWNRKTLNEIAKFRRGSFPQPYGLPEWHDLNGFPFIQVFDVDDNFRLKNSTKSKISKAAAEQSVFIKKGTVIVTIQGSIGKIAITQYDAYIDRTLLLFEKYYQEIDTRYFSYVLFKLFDIEKEKAPGGIIKTITKEVLSEFKINIPTLKEQQKIADCLSSLDELITAHQDKLEALKNHKNGLLQNIFPQDGQKVPNYRFPEFVNDGEWNFLDGDNLFKPISNKNHNSDLPILAITQENGAIPRDRINYNVVVTDKSVESYKVVEIGDFIISLRSFQGGIEYSNYKGICSPAYIILRKKYDYLANDFYKFYFKTSLYINKLNKNLEGIRDGKMISYSQFSEIELPNPNSKEQQKIADCLISVDNLIVAQTQKIEYLKTHKKGLMQGLFPHIN